MVDKGARKGFSRRHRSLVDEVAEHVNLRRDVVEDVLEGFYDILVERLLNEKKFILKNIFSIRSLEVKNGIRPEPHLQLRAKVAAPLRKLFGRLESDSELTVDRTNWRKLLKAETQEENSKPMDLNDFLRSDEEDL